MFIRRSNDVIPEILAVAETFKHSKIIEKPTNCPCCGSLLEDTETELYCPNHLGCKQQIVLKLVQFANRNAMNIDGLSIKTIEALYDKFGTKTFSDLYKITADQLTQLEGFKDKKIKNTLDSLEKSKHVKLSNFIFALGIDNIGQKTAKQLANHFKSIDALKIATIPELISLNDIAEITATGIHHYFNDAETQQELSELIDIIEIENPAAKTVTDSYFSGKKVVLTGTLSKFSRSEAENIIEAQGGSTSSSVTGATNIVLVGENAGSKLAKAQKLGIKIMLEDEFLKIIGQN